MQYTFEVPDELVPILDQVISELRNARDKFPTFNSAHEGYAVILEEVDELWQEVKSKDGSNARMRNEAKQVAAMGMRFMLDVTVNTAEYMP